MIGHRYLWLVSSVLVFAPGGRSEASAAARSPLPGYIRDAIAVKLPRYVPHDPAADAAATDEELQVRNNVVVLPKMTVGTKLPAPTSDMGWLTPRGRLDLALKQYPGTRIGNLFGLNNGWAVFRQVEAVEAGRKDALRERVRDVVLDRTAYDRETRRLLKAALMPINREFGK